MIKIKSILLFFCLFLCTHAVVSILNKDEVVFDVQLDSDILVKKNNINISWQSPEVSLGQFEGYTIQIITNTTLNNGIYSFEVAKVLIKNLTKTTYTWEAEKLEKNFDYYFLVNINNFPIYGLSKSIKYIAKGDLYEYIQDGNNTTDDKSNGANSVNSNDNSKSNVNDVLIKILIVVVVVIIILIIIIVILYTKYYKNKKYYDENGRFSFYNFRNRNNNKNLNSIIINKDIDLISETDSEAAREKLKQEALIIERKKMFSSLSEKALISPESESQFSSGYKSSIFSNSNSDYSWKGMEVMTFAHSASVSRPKYFNKSNLSNENISNENLTNDDTMNTIEK